VIENFEPLKRPYFHINLKVFYVFVLLLIFSSCNINKYVPEDKYLLVKNDLKIDRKEINEKEINSYIRPQPNAKIFRMRFHMRMYCLSSPNKYNWINRWLKTIGEEPVIYDEFLVDKSKKQIKQYLANKGYYYAVIDDSLIYNGKKVSVEYKINAGKPYRLGNVSYNIMDTTVLGLLKTDTVPKSNLEAGKNFDTDLLQEERKRIDKLMKRSGYYDFNQNYIRFLADTANKNMKVDLSMNISSPRIPLPGGRFKSIPHPKYRINDVYFYVGFDPQKAMMDSTYLNDFDTLLINDLHFVYKDKLRIRPEILAQSNYIDLDDWYNYEKVQDTYKALGSLRLFKYSNIDFFQLSQNKRDAISGLLFDDYEDKQKDSLTNYYLDSKIFLTFLKAQSSTVELEGTNSGGDLGGAVNFLHQHNNIFKGAEILNLKLRGQYEVISGENIDLDTTASELGIEASIRTPKFILPFKATAFIKKYNPKTQFGISYNYQQRPEFIRDQVSASFGYVWRGSATSSHALRPLELNKINMIEKNEDYQLFKDIKGTYLESSYNTHSILNASYSYSYNSKTSQKNVNYSFLRFNFESAGLLLTAVNDMAYGSDTDIANGDTIGNYKLLKTVYSQYFLGDFDARYNYVLNQKNSVIYRFNIGLGVPYGNSRALPSEKRFYAGGANGIRGWQARYLGPGSYKDTVSSGLKNYTGDLKIEGNFEYRFKLFSVLEGAVFADIGNIWDLREDETRKGAAFKWNQFYKELAVSGGLGLRANLSFFIFRADLAFKLRDPSIDNVTRWIFLNGSYDLLDNYQLYLTIGYPF